MHTHHHSQYKSAHNTISSFYQQYQVTPANYPITFTFHTRFTSALYTKSPQPVPHVYSTRSTKNSNFQTPHGNTTWSYALTNSNVSWNAQSCLGDKILYCGWHLNKQCSGIGRKPGILRAYLGAELNLCHWLQSYQPSGTPDKFQLLFMLLK
jgi:hypothetical protein